MGAAATSSRAAEIARPALQCEQILASVADAGAGPSYSVQALAGALLGQGAAVTIRSVEGWRASPQRPARAPGVVYSEHAHDYARAPVLSALCASSEMARALETSPADILHAHGLWLMPGLYAARAARKRKVKLVVSPRGMLGAEALDYSSFRKKAFWRLAQKSALEAADCLHATSDAEFEAIRAAGLTAPVAVIPNGVDIPREAGRRAGQRILLSLGRIHPKKGLDRLVEAWSRVQDRFPDWTVRIVGPAEGGHDRELAAQAKALGVKRISIEGAVFGDEKTAVYAGAELFVLPTRNENFAMTVAEALAVGIPVISTTGAPWEGLKTHGCGWWIDQGVDALESALIEAMAMPQEELAQMGGNGQGWMARDFSWRAAGDQMMKVYKWLLLGNDTPKAVRLD